MSNSEESFQTLENLAVKLQTYIDQSGENESVSYSYPAELVETLTILFTLLFDFTEPGQVKVAERCGNSIVHFISNQELYASLDSKDTEVLKKMTSLMCG